MQRYAKLLWDSEKKAVLGKNGVSWMSIAMGTFVVLLMAGIFIHIVDEVKNSHRKSEAEMIKMIEAKTQMFYFESYPFNAKNGSYASTRVVNLQENNSVAEKLKESEETGQSAFILRNKRDAFSFKGKTFSIELINATNYDTVNEKQTTLLNNTTTVIIKGGRQEKKQSVFRANNTGIIKAGNTTRFRFRRQEYPDFTDRTPLRQYEHANLEKLSIGEMRENNKKPSDNRQFCSVNRKEVQPIESTEKLSEMHDPKIITHTFGLAKLEQFKVQNPNDILSGISDETRTEQTERQQRDAKMVRKIENTSSKYTDVIARPPIAKVLNNLATLKLERWVKRSGENELSGERNGDICKKCKVHVAARALQDYVKTNTKKPKTTTFLNKIAEANMEQLKKNIIIVPDLTEILNQVEGYAKDESTFVRLENDVNIKKSGKYAPSNSDMVKM